MSKRRGNHEGNIRLRSDGRWEARASAGYDYITGKEKRISVYGKTKTDVIKKLRELEYTIHNKKSLDPTSTTLVAWMKYWLETYKKAISNNPPMSATEHISTSILPLLFPI